MKHQLCLFGFFVATIVHQPAGAEMVAVSADHFHLKLTAGSKLSPVKLWQRLVVPGQWWHSDHTYSGDSENMSIDVQAGGLWREDWDKGSVAHGRVLFVQAPELLRLDAPFGPLQALSVHSTWTIRIMPEGAGSVVTFEVVANGTVQSKLDQLAPAVEQVKQQALQALVSVQGE
ncbi:MAG: ATPase [bacterium]